MQHLALLNAQCRAVWTLRFFSGTQCADAWPPIARAYADLSLERKRNRAQAWIEAGDKFRRAVELERAGNVVDIRTPSLLRRQAE